MSKLRHSLISGTELDGSPIVYACHQIREGRKHRLVFRCPGCYRIHFVPIVGNRFGDGDGPWWCPCGRHVYLRETSEPKFAGLNAAHNCSPRFADGNGDGSE